MSTAKSSKNFLVKLVAVMAVVALVFGLAPVLDFADFSISASAEAPVYDENLGTITANGSTLTAVPNDGAAFRGWFHKDGTEVSYEPEFTVPNGANKDDYVPVFYSFNLAKNGSFEEYTAGTDLKKGVPEDEIWEGLCDNEVNGKSDWTTAVVTDAKAKSGTKSLMAKSCSNATYHTFYGLEAQTQYTVSFWYYIAPDANNYMNFVSVVGGNMTLTPRANSNGAYLARKSLGSTAGVCTEGNWNQVSLTFYTAENTSAHLAFTYSAADSEEVMYIDDVSLVTDITAAPTYINEDFTYGASNWTSLYADKTTLSKSDETDSRLKAEAQKNMGYIESPVFKLKKDVKYTITFDLDISEITSKTMDGSNQANHLHFWLSTGKGAIPEQSIYQASGFTWTFVKGKKLFGSYYQDVTFKEEHSGVEIAPTTYNTSTYLNGKHKLMVEFVADKTAEVYIGARLNGLGTYYIDNLTIEEDTSVGDYEQTKRENAITTLGTAIRTEGKQGMRYKIKFDKRLLTADNHYGIRFTEYGTLAIKTEYLGDNELTLDGSYAYNGKTETPKLGVAYSLEQGIDKVYKDDFDTIQFTAVLINIAKNNYNTDYTVRTYFKYVDENGENGVMYLEPSDIAVYPVAKAAYSARNKDNVLVESKEVRDYLYRNILSLYTDKVVNVKNDSAALYENFQGISSTVYHGTIFFDDPTHNRTYTDEMAQIEIDRLVDSNIKNVRTRFSSQWMWKDGTGWDWNSSKMKAFYKWGRLLKDNGITITLNAGWHLVDFTEFYRYHLNNGEGIASGSDGHSSIPEVNYLHGYDGAIKSTTVNKSNALYGEDAKAAALAAKAKETLGLDLTDSELAHYSVAAVRYAEWIKQGLVALKQNGVTNVEFVMPFTETGYYTKENGMDAEADPTYCYDEWIIMTVALQDALVDAGIRNNYKLIGPNQSEHASYNREVKFIEYIYQKISGTNYADMIDINSMHQYTTPASGKDIYDPYSCYERTEENFAHYDQTLTNAGVRDKEFWCDEFFANADGANYADNVGMQMTQFAAGIVAGMNKGINRFLSWQMFDTLWDSDAAYSTGEFIGGIHVTGTCPWLGFADGVTCNKADCSCKAYETYSSYVPRKNYYGLNLLGKYLNNENAKVLETALVNETAETDGGLYVSAIENDNGKMVILVVNTMAEASSVKINLEKTTDNVFGRYVYDSNEIVPTAEAESISCDKTIELDGDSFYDIVPAQSFAIYVASGEIIGDDVDMDIPEDFFN